MSLLLFTRDPPPDYKIDFQGKSMAARPDVDGVGKAVVPAPASQSGAFALSAGEWHQLAALANTAMQMRNGIRQLTPRQSALAGLAAAWGPLDGQLDRWGQARDALHALGMDIVGYARAVAPPLYGRMGEILGKLSDGPNPALEAELRQLLDRATAEANGRAQRAAQWSPAIQPFADAARGFVESFYASQRTPPIRIQLDEIPDLCLSVDGNGLTIAGNLRNGGDGMQLWAIEQAGPDGPFSLRTADGSRTLFVDHVDGMESRFSPMLGNMTREQMMPEGPRPHLVPTGDVRNRPETMFWFTGDRYLQPVQWLHHTFDCSGNDGWGQGTPVLNFRKNDGRNQKWKAHPRSFWDLQFYDACRPIGLQAAGIPPFQRLQGDWLAISKDLNDGILGVLKAIDTSAPILAQFDVEDTMKAWTDVANEAQLAIAGL
jgi:hypothetical protein